MGTGWSASITCPRYVPQSHRRPVQESLLTLLPGESITVQVSSGEPIAPEAVLDPTVLRCANQLLGDPVGTPLV